jgi:hypothetical protein
MYAPDLASGELSFRWKDISGFYAAFPCGISLPVAARNPASEASDYKPPILDLRRRFVAQKEVHSLSLHEVVTAE